MDELNGEFMAVRQTLRRAIKQAIKKQPLTLPKLCRIMRRMERLDPIADDDREVAQAVHILVMQKEIELNGDEYIIAGTNPIKKQLRSLDDTWDS